MRRVLLAIDRPLTLLENLFSTLATLIMAAIMLIVTVDVGMRYIFDRPLGWSYDLIDLYLSIFLFYLMLSSAFRRNGHIRVDIVQQYLGPRTRAWFEILSCVSAAAVFLPIMVVTAERCWGQFWAGDLVEGDVDWPSWLSTFAVPLGAGTLTLRLLLNTLSHIRALLTGEFLIPLPPLHAETTNEPGLMVE